MNQRLFFWSLTSALAGFLFGFDVVVISGAEQAIQGLWETTDIEHGIVMSAALWGTVIGSLIGFWPTDKFGRTKTLIVIGLLFLVSAVWSSLATDVNSFKLARFIGGIGVGVATIAAPLYISEISPPRNRGLLAGLFQFNIVFGIMVAYGSNYLISTYFGGENAWRWMMGVEAVPALLYTLFCLGLPASPRWLIAKRGDRDGAARVLKMISPDASQTEITTLADEIAISCKTDQQGTVKDSFWSRRLMKPILLAFLLAFFNQLSGINAILFFAKRIFGLAGLGHHDALLSSIGIGVTNLVFTMVGLWLIDRSGRRTLLYIGTVGYVVSLGLCSYAFFNESFAIVPICVFAFIAAHAVGQGAVIWVLIAEIFPGQHRASGQTWGCATHWVFAALITTFFPMVIGAREDAVTGEVSTAFDPGYIFAFFCGMMVLQGIWIALMVPETKGVSLEEIEKKLGIDS